MYGGRKSRKDYFKIINEIVKSKKGISPVSIKKRIQSIKFINDSYTKYKWRECKKSFGNENENKVFYVVRRANAKVGLFSIVLTSLGYIRYAIEKGYTPVVDMRNYNHYYSGTDGDAGNMWELYFEQPCGYGLETIFKSKKVIMGNGLVLGEVDYPDAQIAYDDEQISFWKNWTKQYLKIKKNILAEADTLFKDMFAGNRVLGVLARGTDYVNAKPANHPIQPTPEQLMEKIDEVVTEKKCTKIYLATEDKGIFEKFRKKYGDMIIAPDVDRYETEGKENINEVRRIQGSDDYTVTKNYLITIILLARCNCIVAGNTSGTIGALLLNKEYEYKYIYNLGLYGENR